MKSIGIPFLITTDVQEAAQHDVVLVYPTISGSILSRDESRMLADIPRREGTLIGISVLGGLQEIIGLEMRSLPATTRCLYGTRVAL